MKTVLSTLALITTICLGAAPDNTEPKAESTDTTAPAQPGATDAAAQQKRASEQAAWTAQHALQDAQKITHDAIQQAMRAKDIAVREAHRAMALAQNNVAWATADAENSPDALDKRFPLQNGFGVVFGNTGRAGSEPLIIRSGEMDGGTLANLQEDLTVMSRILTKTVEKEVGREGHDAAMGIVISTLPGSRRPQSIYLEGYGALFLLNVKFPLIAPGNNEDEKPEKPSDTVWEETKRELYVGGDKSGTAHVWELPGSAAAEYNAEQVDSLKKELTESMKNATHIREVKPDEAITVVVMGGRASGPTRVKHVNVRKGSTGKQEVYMFNDGRNGIRESTLTLRAKKSDVDEFAKGTLDFDQFRKRVAVSAY